MTKPPPRTEFRGGFATKFGGRNVISWRRRQISAHEAKRLHARSHSRIWGGASFLSGVLSASGYGCRPVRTCGSYRTTSGRRRTRASAPRGKRTAPRAGSRGVHREELSPDIC